MRNLCCDALLGQDFQRQHRRIVFTYDGTRPELVISLSPETCVVTAATVECPSLYHDLSPYCRQVAVPSRRYCVHDSAFIESEVKKLYERGIVRTSNSHWRAQPIAVTNKETRKKRLCIDYSQTINWFAVLDAYPLATIDEVVQKLARYRVFTTFDLARVRSWTCAKKKELSEVSKQQAACGGITDCPLVLRTASQLSNELWTRMSIRKNWLILFLNLDNITVGGTTHTMWTSSVCFVLSKGKHDIKGNKLSSRSQK